MLPLDLHVLSLSLAFILSQDQTLRCVYLVCLFFSEEKGTSATHKPEAVPLRLHALVSLVSMTAVMLSPVTIGILTGDPRNPFLVSHLLVRFPHRKHINDLSLEKAFRSPSRPYR